MKKLLKNFAILTVFACGLFTGCNNDAEFDLNVNVTVSTDTPSLDEPKNLGYGVLLTWGITQDANYFRVTRQENGGEEKILPYEGGNRYFDRMDFYNELKEGVEYTYRVYNLGDKPSDNDVNMSYSNNGGWINIDADSTAKGSWYYGDNCVVKTSCAEKKITLAAGSLKKQGEKLATVNKDNVKTSFKKGILKIYLNDENFVWDREVVVRDSETGKKLQAEYNNDGPYYNAQKVNVEIKNVDSRGYYADSDAVTIENIENTSAEEIYISNLTATERDKTVVLLWTTKEKVEASEFIIQRTDTYSNSSKPEILNITPTYGEKYDGTYYWKAVDETVVGGMRYTYTVIAKTDGNSNTSNDVSVLANIDIYSVEYSNYDNAMVLVWYAKNGVSDFKIYRADKYLLNNSYEESVNYDLYKPLDIEFEKVDTLDDKVYYTAKDTTVEMDKSYTYRIMSADGLDCCTYNYNGNTPEVSYIYLDVSVRRNGAYSSSISNTTDDILLSFDGDKNVTYKGYYTTVDNKYNESEKTPIEDFTKDNDKHWRKAFKASAIKDLNKSVEVYFYVECYDGDRLLGKGERSVSIDPSLTTYTSLSFIGAYQVVDYQSNTYKKEITITADGYNFDKVIKITYFKDDGEVKTPKSTLTWTKVTGYDDRYTTTLSVDEYGNYTICATIPEDNAYNPYDLSETTYASVYDYNW